MSKYRFISRIDSSGETIGTVSTNGGIEAATEAFATIKKLSLEDFNKLYKVEPYGRS